MILKNYLLNKPGDPIEQGFGHRSNQVFDGLYETGRQYFEVGIIACKEKKLIMVNLWHLGIEMILKSGIVRKYKLDSVQDTYKILEAVRKAYSHNLQKLWSDFKELYYEEDNGLSIFDKVITDLEPWTDIKYPRVQEESIIINREDVGIIFSQKTNFQIDKPVSDYVIDTKSVEDFHDKLRSLLSRYSIYDTINKHGSGSRSENTAKNMHQTKLVEFPNKTGDLLRGVLLSSGNIGKAVLVCGGFERSATTEKKFKVLADELVRNGVISLRFDYTGCGLSDGDFSKTTTKSISGDIHVAADFLKKETGIKSISVVCHSLGACAIANLLNDINFTKIVLLSPALNQKDLLRYWFVKSAKEKQEPIVEINWSNFRDYLDEKQFQEDCLRTDKMTKANYISSDYFLENKDKDYSGYFKNNQNILHIHGDKDNKVPLESLNVKFDNKIIIKGGDHDLERPDMFGQWIKKAVDFVK